MEDTTKIRTYFNIEFNGKAGEYFRIWIVNVLLSIITLGIYSAWAKVRTNQYFYGNTFLDNSSFEYTADPINILKGRVIAVILLAAYQLFGYFYPQYAGFGLLVIVLLIPAIVVKAVRFRMRYSRWRGIHFNFIRDYKAAYKVFSPAILYVAFTAIAPLYLGINPQELGQQETAHNNPELQSYFMIIGFSFLGALLLFPWWQKTYYNFITNRTQFGTQSFGFLAHTSEFYGIYFGAFALAIGSGILIAIFAWISSLLLPSQAMGFIAFLIFIPYVLSIAYVQTTKTNIIYSNLELGDIFFTSELKLKKMMYLYVTNTLAILLTLGLAIPWAKVRMAAYRAETLKLYSYGFDDFSAMVNEQEKANAEELSELFGWDIGL